MPGKSHTRKPIDLKVVFLLALCAGGILIFLRVIGFDGLYGQDAYAYANHTKDIVDYLINGTIIPEFHWPSGYPIFCLPLQLITQNVTWSLQLTSVIFWIFSIYQSARILEFLVPGLKVKTAALLCIATIGFSPYFLRLGFTGMSDIAGAFFVITAIRYYLEMRQQFNMLGFWLLFLSAGMAVFMRYATAIVVVFPMISGLIIAIKTRGKAVLGIALFILIFSGIMLTKNPNELLDFTQDVLEGWSPMNLFRSQFENIGGQFNYSFPNGVYILFPFFHPGFFFFGIISLILALRSKRPFPWALFIPVAIYLLFLGGLNLQNNRFFVIVVPIIGIIQLYYLLEIIDRLRKIQTALIIGVGVLNFSLAIYSAKTIYRVQQEEIQLNQAISKFNMQRLYTFEVDVAFQTRGFKGELKNLWLENEVQLKSGDHVLVNPDRWQEKWKDHQLGENLTTIKNDTSLKHVQVLTNGWELLRKK